MKSDPLLRLLIADLVGEQVTRESIATLREAIADLQARLAETEAPAEAAHRRKYLLLVTGHLRRLLRQGVPLEDRS